jgi:predicted PurR-regulated permease PerM
VTSRSDSARGLIRYALVGIVVTIAVSWVLLLIRDILLLIYMSGLVAIGLGPLVNKIEGLRLGGRLRTPRWAAILVIYVFFVGTLIALGMMVIPPLVAQARALWAALPALVHNAQQWLIDRGLLSQELSFIEVVQQSPLPGSDAVGTLMIALWGFIGGLFGLVTILILAFYFLVDARNIFEAFVRLFPRDKRSRVEDACARVSTKVSGWVGGQLLLATIIGGSAALGLYIMGVPYFYVLALIAGLGEMMPIVGPLLAAIPAVIVALSVSPGLALAVTAFFVFQQQFENHLLVPKLMERQVGVSAVVVVLSILVGGSLLGVVGAILAVPSAAIAQVLLEELVFPEQGD